MLKTDEQSNDDVNMPTTTDQGALLASLWHNSGMGLCVLDGNNHFLTVNDTLCAWFERSREDLLTHTFIDLMPLDDQQRHETYRIYREMMQLETEPVLTMWPIQTASGQVRQLQAQGSLFRDEQDQVRCLVVSHLAKKSLDGADEMHYRSLIEQQNQILVTRWLPDGTLTFVNQAYAKFFGTPHEACIGRKIADVLEGDSRAMFLENLANSQRHPAAFVHTEHIQDASGQGRWMRWVNEPIFDDRGQVRFFQGMGTDVTEKVAQENDLMAREALFRRITETMADVVAMHTLEGIYTYLSPSVETVLGYQPDELVGQNPYHYFHPEDQERIHHESHDPSIEQQETQKISYRYLHKAGHYIWIETQTMPVTDGAGNVIAIQTVSRDVSALKYSEDAYETLVNNALQGFVLLQDDRIVFANPRAEEVLGYPLEVLQNLTPEVQNQIIHPDDLPGVLEHLDNIASGREQTARYTTRIIQPSGRILWLEFSTTASSYRGKPALQTAFIDISDKVNTEHALAKSETRYREIVEVNVGSVYSYFCYPPEGSVADPLISQADWHWVRDWEPESTTYALTGYTLAEMDVLGGYPALIVPEDQAAFEGSRHQLQAGDVRTTNYRLITKGSNVIWMEDFIKVIADSYQRRACLRVYGSNRNISERKQAELVLQAALTEKDIMLKEIHHRVKNNMQVISSLLALQSHTVDDIRARQAFAESRQRILAMAEVHKKIYESPDLAGIDFLNYLGYLVRTFGASYRAVAVQVQLEGDPINLGVEQAVPLGLIANELLSNVYKHAFPAGRGRVSEPLVRVNLQLEPYPDGHQVVLTIADNGVGIPEDVQAQSDSLGMTIIYSLIDQLEARVQFTAGITETGIETSTEVDTDTEADTGIAVKITCNWIKPTSKTDTDQFFESHASRPHN